MTLLALVQSDNTQPVVNTILNVLQLIAIIGAGGALVWRAGKRDQEFLHSLKTQSEHGDQLEQIAAITNNLAQADVQTRVQLEGLRRELDEIKRDLRRPAT